MFHTLDEFYQTWSYESEATMKIFGALTDTSLQQNVTPEGRNLGILAWHITESISEVIERTGLKVFKPLRENFKKTSPKDLLKIYKTTSDSLIENMKANWTNQSLQIEDDMYGEKWKRLYTLGVLITHQIHHRGQMTVLMRQAGLKVPGIYGPSKEEWSQWGLEAQL
jgi:uncharacterized damage-inducible protein DinB